METQTHKATGVYFSVKNNLSEMNLDTFVSWLELEEKVLEMDHKIQDLEMLVEVEEVDAETAEDLETEYSLTKYDAILDQLKLIVAPEDHFKLSNLTRLDWLGLKMSAQMQEYTDYEKGVALVIPGANDEQVADLEEHLENDIPKADKVRRAEVQLRIDKLKKNEFILLPVQDAIFATKARTDALRKQLPKVPEEVEDARLDEKDERTRKDLALYIEKLERELDAKNLDKTQKEVQERLRLSRTIKRWQKKTDTEVHRLADQFLTHFLLPVDEPYSMKYAEARRPSIRKLPLSKVLPLINFILAVLKI